MPQKPGFRKPKPTDVSKAESHAILAYPQPGMPIPHARIETRLRKVRGVKEVAINHVCHTIKIRYDPSIVTFEKIRAFLSKPVSLPRQR